MLSKEEIKRIESMSDEEKTQELLDGISDVVRTISGRLMMVKAIAYRENDIAPEDFDKALERELRKAWNKVKDKTSEELALMAFAELVANGANPIELLGGRD